MQIRLLAVRFVVLVVMLLVPHMSRAGFAGGPSPIEGFEPDDGSELFTPMSQVMALEIFDPASFFVPAEFGFYYESDPGTLIAIFEEEDQDPDNTSGSGPNPQLAQVDFDNGQVFDLDEGVLQSEFILLSENIGFYFKLLFPGEPLTLFSQTPLNGGVDSLGTFPRLGETDQYLLVFEFQPTGDLITVELLGGVIPVPVPEPALSGLLALALLAAARRARP